jgi:hypothetical protein
MLIFNNAQSQAIKADRPQKMRPDVNEFTLNFLRVA